MNKQKQIIEISLFFINKKKLFKLEYFVGVVETLHLVVLLLISFLNSLMEIILK
jgi:hypothetical protein